VYCTIIRDIRFEEPSNYPKVGMVRVTWPSFKILALLICMKYAYQILYIKKLS